MNGRVSWVALGVAAASVAFYVTPSALLAVGLLSRAAWSLRRAEYLTANLCLIFAVGFGLHFRWQQVPVSFIKLRRSVIPVYRSGTPDLALEGLQRLNVFGTRCPPHNAPESIERLTANAMTQMLHGREYKHLLLQALDAVHESSSSNASNGFCANVGFLRTISKLDSCPALSTFLG